MIVALCSAINLSEQPRKARPQQDNSVFGANAHPNRSLSFADRVAYQRAIEDVYWRHRIWPKERPDPKPSLDVVMSQAQLEMKVEEYLRKSHTLEDHWQKPITAEQLQTEMERMASHTKQPEVLRELFVALGNDPFVIAECLARPLLAERFANDPVATEPTLSASRAGVPPVLAFVATPLQGVARNVPQARGYSEQHEIQAPMTMAAVSSTNYTLPVIASPSAGCIDDTWTPTALTNAPAPRSVHTAVWTGSEMIVWGGVHRGGVYASGGRYNPSADSWTATTTNNAPIRRTGHTAVWTGSEMIVWGGIEEDFHPLNTGGRYNPSTDSWTATSTTNAPAARTMHTAVWTGSEMIVWGGFDNGQFDFNSGGRYDPNTDSWTATSTTSAPEARELPRAVWTGSEMIVWGGTSCIPPCPLNTGGRYDPVADSWTAASTTSAPEGRYFHTAVWTSSEMIVWGGQSPPDFLGTGGRYCAAAPSATPTPTATATPSASARPIPTARPRPTPAPRP